MDEETYLEYSCCISNDNKNMRLSFFICIFNNNKSFVMCKPEIRKVMRLHL